jgi:hypothetical protein
VLENDAFHWGISSEVFWTVFAPPSGAPLFSLNPDGGGHCRDGSGGGLLGCKRAQRAQPGGLSQSPGSFRIPEAHEAVVSNDGDFVLLQVFTAGG